MTLTSISHCLFHHFTAALSDSTHQAADVSLNSVTAPGTTQNDSGLAGIGHKWHRPRAKKDPPNFFHRSGLIGTLLAVPQL